MNYDLTLSTIHNLEAKRRAVYSRWITLSAAQKERKN